MELMEISSEVECIHIVRAKVVLEVEVAESTYLTRVV